MANFFTKLFRRKKKDRDSVKEEGSMSKDENVQPNNASASSLSTKKTKGNKKKRSSIFQRRKQQYSTTEDTVLGGFLHQQQDHRDEIIHSHEKKDPADDNRDHHSKNEKKHPSNPSSTVSSKILTARNNDAYTNTNLHHSSYHDHPFAMSKSYRHQQQQELTQLSSAAVKNQIFDANFANFENRENEDSLVHTNSERDSNKRSNRMSHTTTTPTLSYDTLQRFEQLQMEQQRNSNYNTNHPPHSSLNQNSSTTVHTKANLMHRLPNGQLVIQSSQAAQDSHSTNRNTLMSVSAVNTSRNYPNRLNHFESPRVHQHHSVSLHAAQNTTTTMSPSAQSDFCLSTDVEDDDYNRLRKQAARNLSPMLDKDTMSDDDSISDDDDFYGVSQNQNNKTTGILPLINQENTNITLGISRQVLTNANQMNSIPADLNITSSSEYKTNKMNYNFVPEGENERYNSKFSIQGLNHKTPASIANSPMIHTNAVPSRTVDSSASQSTPSNHASLPRQGGNNNYYFSDSETEIDTFDHNLVPHDQSSSSNVKKTTRSNQAPTLPSASSFHSIDSSYHRPSNFESNKEVSSNHQFAFNSGFDDSMIPSKKNMGSFRNTSTAGGSNNEKINTIKRSSSPSPTSGDDRHMQQQESITSHGQNLQPQARIINSHNSGKMIRADAVSSKISSLLYPDSSDSEDDDKEDHTGHETKAQAASGELNGEPHSKGKPAQMLRNSHHTSRDQTSDSNGNAYSHQHKLNENVKQAQTTPNRSSRSLADQTSPVSEYLALAKSKREKRKSSSSVGGAPNLSADFLREHHNLKAGSMKSSRDHHAATSPESAKEKLDKRRMEKDAILNKLTASKDDETSDSDGGKGESAKNDAWLFDEVTGALGPRGIAADLESLGGRSNRSRRSHRSQKSKSSKGGTTTDEHSVGSKQSRTSRYSAKSSKSHLSQMSEQSRSVANDLIRLEMQLAMVGSQGKAEFRNQLKSSSGSASGENKSLMSASTSFNKSNQKLGSKYIRKKVMAPPGKLGIILANRTDCKGTVVSGVRTASVLADTVLPGDRLIAIDGEDVSMMTVSEITSLMARKNDFDRELTILTSTAEVETSI